ncbi:hypothetical protein [Silvanigrella aquatica]|nr:hypothetical protein [Silvanigrella aquatica]
MRKIYSIKNLLNLIIIILIIPNPVFAESIPTNWNGVRPSGMGGAFTATSNDETSVFNNPAGLSETRNPTLKKIVQDINLLDAEVGGNTQMLSNMHSDPTGWGTDFINSAKNNPGKQSYFLFQSFEEIILGAKNSATYLIGFPIRSENKMAFVDTSNPTKAYTVSTTTVSGAFAVAGATQRGLFRYGLSVRPNYRLDYQNNTLDTTNIFSTNDLANVVTNNGQQTTGVGLDAGFTITAADFWFPTFGMALRNIPTGCVNNYINPINQNVETMCGSVRTGGSSNSTTNASNVDPTEVRVGFSLTPRGKISGSKVNLRLSVDVYPLPIQIDGNNYGVDGIDTNRLIHAGAELFFGNVLIQQGFALRAGYMEGGATFGTSLSLALFSIEYSTYLMNDTLPQPNNTTTTKIVERRHLLAISYHW